MTTFECVYIYKCLAFTNNKYMYIIILCFSYFELKSFAVEVIYMGINLPRGGVIFDVLNKQRHIHTCFTIRILIRLLANVLP